MNVTKSSLRKKKPLSSLKNGGRQKTENKRVTECVCVRGVSGRKESGWVI